jgi:class 3 adenylate cyclase/ketosteroid isomerase-like protein
MKADPQTEAGVCATLDDVMDSFAANDVERWLRCVVPEDDMAWIATGPEEYAKSRAELASMMLASIEGTTNRHGEWHWIKVSAHGEVAWVHGEATISAHAGGRDIDLPFRFTGVLVRRDGRWLIAQFHQSVGDARQLGATWDSLMDTVALDVAREQPDLAMQTAPDGIVTLLFSDIEDSTGLNERLGDRRWMEALREHNAIVREGIAAYSGAEVKTIGDAFMVAFSSARRAVLCAIDLERAFAAYNREHDEAPLLIRIGLHAGEPVREGGDFFGKSVTLASRIAGHARGGEILASALVRELVEASGDIPLGEVRGAQLKGFADEQRLCDVPWRL